MGWERRENVAILVLPFPLGLAELDLIHKLNGIDSVFNFLTFFLPTLYLFPKSNFAQTVGLWTFIGSYIFRF